MASDGADSRYVLIKASEGKAVVVTKAVAMQSPALKKIIESELSTTQIIIEMTYLSEAILNKIFEYCEKHLYDGDCNPTEYKNEIMDFDKKFVDVDKKQLYKIAEIEQGKPGDLTDVAVWQSEDLSHNGLAIRRLKPLLTVGWTCLTASDSFGDQLRSEG
ncbi:hypothetical protein KSP40_PGU016130 [Platanthera guangdongensis]|uniref:SKP1 component POZ domain-containing protein n=1 Tax=Platanthera guangdongensis TaxID=2320717 RepID=A0ABR2LI95_9ASPA